MARLGERVRDAVEDFGGDGGTEQFKIDAGDFLEVASTPRPPRRPAVGRV